MKKRTIGHHGEIVSIGAHHSNPKFMSLSVAHGPKPKPPRAKKGVANVTGFYDDRPTSSIVVPKAHASRYRIGQKVGVGAVPLDGDADDGSLEDYFSRDPRARKDREPDD